MLMLFALLAGAILEATLPPAAFFGGARAPVLLGVVLYYALNRSGAMASAAGVCAGIVRDGVLGLPLGCSAFFFLVFGWFIAGRRWRWFLQTWFTRATLGAACGAVLTWGVYLCLRLGGWLESGASFGHILMRAAGVALLGAFSAMAIVPCMERLDRMLGNISLPAENTR